MTLNEILLIMQNRILYLNEAKKSAILCGDLERVTQIEADLATTKSSLEKIKQFVELAQQ